MRRSLIAYKRTHANSQKKANTHPTTNRTKSTGRLISIARKLVTTILFMAKAIHTTEEQTGHSLLLNKSTSKTPNTITINITDMPIEEVLKVKFSLQPGKFKQPALTLIINIAEGQENVNTHPQSTTIEIEGVAPNETGTPLVAPTVDIRKMKKTSPTNDKGKFHLTAAKPDHPKMNSMSNK